jgi:hypothetical protein
MRQRLGIIITVVLVLGVLVTINSISYVSKEEKQDSEFAPNRSTYHAGPTGTRALYDLLSESGYKVIRWRETPEKLPGDSGRQVQTFVIIGDTQIPVDRDEASSLLLWVERGGRLVIVDRRPEIYLLPPSGDWTINTEYRAFPGFEIDPGDPKQMTEGIKPLRPVQPTVLTRDVESVMPSKFFADIKFSAPSKVENEKTKPAQNSSGGGTGPPIVPPAPKSETNSSSDSEKSISPAPVVHSTSSNSVLLLDYPHGLGRIVVLSDPFIVANGGIGLKDNLQLAINLVSNGDGVIAFDEFHQGRGIMRNAFASYFAGTPILAICGQIVMLILLMVWTKGRRFARPLPLPVIDRRSSLEFVASMAELQQRAGAFDLAIENVYSRTRRVLARYAGVDYNSPRSNIAQRVADRSRLNAHQLETLMRQSEEAINSGTISERQSIYLVGRLREVEASLGLRMRSREVKQTAQNI